MVGSYSVPAVVGEAEGDETHHDRHERQDKVTHVEIDRTDLGSHTTDLERVE